MRALAIQAERDQRLPHGIWDDTLDTLLPARADAADAVVDAAICNEHHLGPEPLAKALEYLLVNRGDNKTRHRAVAQQRAEHPRVERKAGLVPELAARGLDPQPTSVPHSGEHLTQP